MRRISAEIKAYAWGSHEALAQLAGRPTPSAEPEAELWVGAHEAGPATLEDGTTLDAVIAADPAGQLGERTVQHFGQRLPFLLKILAASKALSIQAHPGADRAASAPDGTYADSWPKPEAWVPLTECVAFAGSLPFDVVAARLRALNVAALTALVEASAASEVPEHGLLEAILTVPAQQHARLVTEVMDAVAAQVASGELAPEQQAAWETSLDVLRQFPGDIGVLVTLTMNHLVMRPGLSYFIDAGVLHSFVGGTTVEILANSDNVVRAGLTPKKIDVAELLQIVDVHATVSAAEPVRDGDVARYFSPVPHFSLTEVTPGEDPVPLPGDGEPALLMALEAPVTVRSGDAEFTLDRLETAWWPANAAPAQVTGQEGARLFVASINADVLAETA